MSHRGHVVKPTAKRRTWAIIYRDPTGVQHWEGNFKKRTEAQARLAARNRDMVRSSTSNSFRALERFRYRRCGSSMLTRL
jgi:hypothetical protein